MIVVRAFLDGLGLVGVVCIAGAVRDLVSDEIVLRRFRRAIEEQQRAYRATRGEHQRTKAVPAN